jgi:hypothetical protein
MSVSVKKYFESRIFQSGELSQLLRELIVSISGENAKIHISLSRRLRDGLTERRTKLTLEDLQHICDIPAENISIVLNFGGEGTDIGLSIESTGNFLAVHVSALTPESLYAIIAQLTKTIGTEEVSSPYRQLEEVSESEAPSIPEQINELRTGIEEVRALITKREKRFRCFLSYRFDKKNEEVALRLQRFLSLLDVEVVTGASYEPRRVVDKVIERLNQSIDFIVLIVGAGGESTWTRDEISFAGSKGIPIIPLVETGAKFEPGIFGDLEYIPFESGHIGDVFIGLLEAIKYIREKLVAPSSQPSEAIGSPPSR